MSKFTEAKLSPRDSIHCSLTIFGDDARLISELVEFYHLSTKRVVERLISLGLDVVRQDPDEDWNSDVEVSQYD